MAAATSLVDAPIPTAVRSKGARVRERAQVGGARGRSFQSKEAARERDAQAGRLTEDERGELLLSWGGFGAALGCRSSQGAVEDRLLRSPPRDGRALERAVLQELRRHGRAGLAREKAVRLVGAEEGATPYEVRRALRAMVGRGEVEFFTEEAERDAQQPRLLVEPYGMLTGPERAGRYAPTRERLTVEMVRLGEPGLRLALADEDADPTLDSRQRAWARQDEALERYCRTMSCGDAGPGGSGRLPDFAQGRQDGGVLSALRAIGSEDRRTIERAYGVGGSWAGREYLGAWAAEGEEVARLAPYTPSAETARLELARARATTPGSLETVDRATFAADALRAKLDGAPAEEGARERWRAEREAFITRVGREAAAMLKVAVEAYRSTRARSWG